MKTFTTVVEILDSPNRNGRTYTKEVIQKAIDAYRPKFGYLGMTKPLPRVELERVSHEISNIRIIDNDLLCDIDILDTPIGKILSGLPPSVSVQYRLSGFGDIDVDGVVTNYTMTSINAVNE